MKEFPVPDNEDERLKSLKRLNLLDTPAEDRFDRITRLACDALDVENAAINLVDADRQWGKSTCGVEDTEASRDKSFCAHAIMDEEIMVVEDTKQDDRFRDNDFVDDDPYIRFYMGHPVHSPDDRRIGTLCVFDTKPRDPDEEQERILRDLAGIVDSEISRNELDIDRARLRENLEEAERRARIDGLTDLWNRRAVLDLLEAELNRSNRDELPIGVAMLDLDDFKSINDTHGHQAGDEILRVTAERIRQSVRNYDVVGRYGGEEFIVVFPESDRSELKEVSERIRRNISQSEIIYDDRELIVTVSIGLSEVKSGEREDSETLINQADIALYKAKELGKNQVYTFENGD